MNSPRINGLIAAPFTPMNPDTSINLEMIESYGQHLRRDGVVGAFICGTTGEAMSLTVDERMKVAERWMEKAPKDLRVIVHVGHTTLSECRRLSSHAQSIGAASVSCIAPFFFKPNSPENLVEWCVQVASAAPKLPFYYYHIPSMTGVSIPVHEFLKAVGNRIPNLVGVKFTYEDLEDFRKCLEFENGRYEILFGRDEMLLPALSLGGRGAVGSTYNFAAPIYQKLIAALNTGDRPAAEKQQALAVKMTDALIAAGPSPLATYKWLMKRIGLDCGPARLPMQNPSPEQIQRLEKQLEEIGFFDARG